MTAFDPPKNVHIDPFRAMAVLDAAQARERAGLATYHFEVGQPGSLAPPSARAAVAQALAQDRMGYSASLGRPELREALAQYYETRYGVTVDPGQIVVTTGASGGIQLSLLACFDKGARIGLTAPGYPAYRNMIQGLGFQPVLIEVGPQSNFQPTPQLLAGCGPLDGLIIASPSNPTGTMLSPSEFEAIYQWSETSGVRLLSDEIYHGLTWGQPESTAAGRPGSHAIVLNSFSKYFSMTGWRVGWMVAPQDVLEMIERLSQNLFICAPTVSQVAAQGALQDLDYLDEIVDGYRQREQLVAQFARQWGLATQAATDGAFYAYWNVSKYADSSTAFARRALDEAGAALVPGVDFDPINGEQFVRLSFAGAQDEVEAGLDALARWLQK